MKKKIKDLNDEDVRKICNKQLGCSRCPWIKLIGIDYYKVVPFYAFENQEDVDCLQNSMNILKKDLEVLKEYEN